MRAHQRRTERNLVVGIVLMFIVGGSVAIGLVYGWSAVFTALICLLPGALVFILLWLVLKIADRFSQ